MNLEGLTVSDDVAALNPQLYPSGKAASKPASKYRNSRQEFKGLRFQSGHEAAGVAGLILMEEQHEIFALRLQVRFPLPGKTVYVADACYCELRDGVLTLVVKDFKGYPTAEFKLKRRLFRERYGIDIETA